MWSGGTVPLSLNIGITWRHVVAFTIRPIYRREENLYQLEVRNDPEPVRSLVKNRKMYCPCRNRIAARPSGLVTTPAELSPPHSKLNVTVYAILCNIQRLYFAMRAFMCSVQLSQWNTDHCPNCTVHIHIHGLLQRVMKTAFSQQTHKALGPCYNERCYLQK